MQKISDCEEKVMLVMWQEEETITYKDIQAKVEEKFGDKWKPETVCSFMDRLKKKGYLYSFKEGRYTHYRVAIDFKTYRKMKVDEIVYRLYEGSKSNLIKDLIE